MSLYGSKLFSLKDKLKAQAQAEVAEVAEEAKRLAKLERESKVEKITKNKKK